MASNDKSSTKVNKRYNTRSSKSNDTKNSKISKDKVVNKKDKKEQYANHVSSDEDDDDDDYSIGSDDEYTDDEEDDDDEYTDDDDDEDETDVSHEYQKLLLDLFPSKYMKEKVDKSKKTKSNKKNKKVSISDEEDVSDDDDYEDVSEEEDDEQKPSKFNISFIINEPQNKFSSENSLFDEDEEDTEEEEENDTEEDTEDEEEDDEKYMKKGKSKKSGKKKDDDMDVDVVSSSKKHDEDVSALKKMKDLLSQLGPDDKKNTVVKTILQKIENEEKSYLKNKVKKEKKSKVDNTKKLKKLLREKDVMNDLKYFHEKMSLDEQKSALEQIELIHKHSYIDKPYRLSLLEADIPIQYKASAYRKISTLRFMEPGGGEYFKIKNWVDAFMQIPFGKYKSLDISLANGVDKCHEFMDNAKSILDSAVYGLNDAKLQIMQMIGQWIVNPNAIGTSIAIKGPMGTGKTTLVKDGISKILGRDFAFIALGGATDSSFLEGHSYTYEGSVWGKIVELLIKCKSMNPVIYFDELDKISDSPKGEEIIGILTHLTDTTQNSQFHDRYFSEIDFDLSRCLFIFSYNDESKVNRILLDRMYKIQTKGYEPAQKIIIANNYLIPKICEQVKFETKDIIISEDTMSYLITNYTDKEDGVRTLKRCLEIIHTKLNLYRLMKPDTNIFENEMSIKVEFPMQVTPSIIDKLIKKNMDNGCWINMYS